MQNNIKNSVNVNVKVETPSKLEVNNTNIQIEKVNVPLIGKVAMPISPRKVSANGKVGVEKVVTHTPVINQSPIKYRNKL